MGGHSGTGGVVAYVSAVEGDVWSARGDRLVAHQAVPVEAGEPRVLFHLLDAAMRAQPAGRL